MSVELIGLNLLHGCGICSVLRKLSFSYLVILHVTLFFRVSANFFVNEAAPMFRWCEKVFEGADGEIKEFIQGLNGIVENMTPGE